MNGYGKLRRLTDKRKTIVDFYLYLAAALTVIRRTDQQSPHPLPGPPGRPPAPSMNIICRSISVLGRRVRGVALRHLRRRSSPVAIQPRDSSRRGVGR